MDKIKNQRAPESNAISKISLFERMPVATSIILGLITCFFPGYFFSLITHNRGVDLGLEFARAEFQIVLSVLSLILMFVFYSLLKSHRLKILIYLLVAVAIILIFSEFIFFMNTKKLEPSNYYLLDELPSK